MQSTKKLYCSLDIETSGFDPLINEILEVGFVFFTVTDKGLKIVEEWTQVFKPSKPVSPQIFGLTGITQTELDKAPKFSEHLQFLQNKLGAATIVGHNVGFDIKFLQAFGLNFSGAVIDTLDLVQWLLPTHHSYNLENLMHVFGISHKEAHRALADSKATLKLLENLLKVYCGFPESVKLQITKLLEHRDLSWKELLTIQLPPLVFKSNNQNLIQKISKTQELAVALEDKTFYNLSLNQPFNLLSLSPAKKSKLLLVLPTAQEVLEYIRLSPKAEGVFLPKLLFNEKKLGATLKKTDLSAQEINFLLKIVVWKELNWQKQTILDLNLSFFGGQFRSLVSGGKIKSELKSPVAVCDIATFFYLAGQNLFLDRHVVGVGLNEFENSLTNTIGSKISWSQINYFLKSIYDPESGHGAEQFKEEITKAMLAGDLFFVLVNALLQTDPPSFLYFKISEQTLNDEKYIKIKTAAEHYIEKLRTLNETLKLTELEKTIQDFSEFFIEQPNRVKWIELATARCVFFNLPLEIASLVNESLGKFAAASFFDQLDSKLLPQFFLKRLGLMDFKISAIKSKPGGKVGQGDLFAEFKQTFFSKAKAINYHCLPESPNPDSLVKIVSKAKNLPAALLFSSPSQVKEFYEKNYALLKPLGNLLVQSASGGSNKIFRNFFINPKSLLLATDKFIVKAQANNAAVEKIKGLPVKTLILCRLPFEQFSHPYQEAVSASLPNSFIDYALPRAFYNFHSIIKFFYSPSLTDIYIIDAKLAKDYASVFINYYQTLPLSIKK